MGKKKIKIVKCSNRAGNSLFQGRDAPFYKYKNRAASPMTLNEGGAVRAGRGKNIHPWKRYKKFFVGHCSHLIEMFRPTIFKRGLDGDLTFWAPQVINAYKLRKVAAL